MVNIFEPKLVGFLCNWCAYSGADSSGVQAESYPSNLRIIAIPCSGSIEPSVVVETLDLGADGVLVLGCPLGGCHYVTGNYVAQRRVIAVKKLFVKIGIDARRIDIQFLGASEGKKFAKVVSDFTERVRKLGPWEDRAGLALAKAVVNNDRFRWLLGREKELIDLGDAFGRKHGAITKAIEQCLEEEVSKTKIVHLLADEPLSCEALAQKLGSEPSSVLRYILELKREGQVYDYDELDRSPRYAGAR
jgi:F420-non-reducing hydrogenase iron-sulfur subunit